ncbi:MAG: tRNA (adenosine(37)-N6)-threonylcarbamoyltransferase complex ATPase subunit type 1 TsaE [Bacteroidetes bacterium]|nr:tRNA (adenosine(37)-N6)-threonylcarbamoyltransferase complex ATPase subunit type 1 TsaE [Bacteroidota bacterium]
MPFQISFGKDTLADAARQFWTWAQGVRVISFYGGLGAGKTTFIHALCEVLGVADTVSSPTFALINEYRYPEPDGAEGLIYHMDWYRLSGPDEAMDAGMEDALMQPDARCFVEWPERAELLLAMKHIRVKLTIQKNDLRLLEAQVVEAAHS